MASVAELVPVVGVTVACEAVGMPRASFYRQTGRSANPVRPSLRDEGAAGERSELSVPGASAVVDRVHPRALSVDRTGGGARRAALRPASRTRLPPPSTPPSWMRAPTSRPNGRCTGCWRPRGRPVHAATSSSIRPTRSRSCWRRRPNQVWSWDITKLLGPAKWTYFYLYVILDVYSRYVVGWMVAHREQADLAERLIAETLAKQAIPAGQLTLHADRGSSMTSKPVAFLLADLGVTKTHSRPHVSNDNPYSEAQFKTLKYRPGFPDRFASIEEARAFCQDFFRWYNAEHRHAGIGLLAPEVVHYGQAQDAYDARAQVLATAYAAHPERFVRQAPRPPQLPTAAWINPPKPPSDAPSASEETRQ